MKIIAHTFDAAAGPASTEVTDAAAVLASVFKVVGSAALCPELSFVVAPMVVGMKVLVDSGEGQAGVKPTGLPTMIDPTSGDTLESLLVAIVV